MEENLLAYLLWIVSSLGPANRKINKLIERFHTPQELYFSADSEIESSGILNGFEYKTLIDNRDFRQVEKILDKCQKNGIRFLTVWDEDYPSLLDKICCPPILLFCKGESVWENGILNIAVAGTRKMTAYASRMVGSIVKDLSNFQCTIIGGLSEGIDACAHLAALRNRGNTTAILPCGLDVIYPYVNYNLYWDIAENGCILSEFLPGTPALGRNFQLRNRLIAAMSNGVLLAQAPEKSGSMITIKYAAEYGRDIFALPGDADVAQSEGPNSLIKSGAKLTSTAMDIIEEYSYLFAPSVLEKLSDETKTVAAPSKIMNSDSESYKVIKLLCEKDMDVSSIAQITEIPFGELIMMLTDLQIKGIIFEKPGGLFAVSKNVTI